MSAYWSNEEVLRRKVLNIGKRGATYRRLQWLRRLSRSFSKNKRSIDLEERAYLISEWAARIVCAVIIIGLIQASR